VTPENKAQLSEKIAALEAVLKVLETDPSATAARRSAGRDIIARLKGFAAMWGT
jgi:hypothetical protein